MLPRRNFGIELEVIGFTPRKGWSILRENDITDWDCVEDTSICSCLDTNPDKTCYGPSCKGCEMVSPILQGTAGIHNIKKVLKSLVKSNAGVNKSCGFHVHVDAGDLTVQQCENIYRRFAHFEKQMDLLHPADRRGSKNYFCLSTLEIIDAIKQDKIKINCKQTLAEIGDKYYKLNLASLEKFGTLEFRQHTGTLDQIEIENWIKFCLTFVEASLFIKAGQKGDELFFGFDDELKEYFEQRIRLESNLI